MGEIYCCSSSQRARGFDVENKESIGKINFSKKYIIGVGGFSKVSIFIIIILIKFIFIFIDLES